MPLAPQTARTADDTPPPVLNPESVHAHTVRNWVAGPGSTASPVDSEPAAILRDLDDRDPSKANRLREAIRRFPAVGTSVAGFQLVALLGKGAFGRVYLARQGDLAERYVALKVSADLSGESQTLAQLQHTNIVPVYSVHRSDPFQAVCMPYLGPITLASLLNRCRQRNALPTTGRELVNTLSGLSDDTEIATRLTPSRASTVMPDPSVRSATRPETAGADGTLPERPAAVLRLLSGLTYVDAVCWIGNRLADALAHAHERGIVHNDLKPANVLLADDGQPMLLDFGVSNDLKIRAEAPNAPVGGTLPYMSPEQLESSLGGDWTPEPRSDVYALGVILYELLTGSHPFRLPTEGAAREVARMVAERRAGPPRLRDRHPAVSPGLEAIIRKALQPDPARRYQSAADLRDDLDRHRTDRPLKHAANPSVRERLNKWARRHPRLTSNATLAAVAGAVVVALGFGLDRRSRQIDRYEAEAALRATDPDIQAARYQLISRAPSADLVSAGVVRSRAALDRYGVLSDPDWERRPQYASLTADEQKRLRTQLSEACILLARGLSLGQSGGPDASERLREAVRMNERAEQLAGDAVPVAVWRQRADLYDQLGDHAAAAQYSRRAFETPVVTARDNYLAGRDDLRNGRLRSALKQLERATELDPTLFWAHFAQGLCYDGLGLFAQARSCYIAAAALWPEFPWVYYNRGLVSLRLGDYAKAQGDFDRVIELEPKHADSYLNRAMALYGQRKYAAGLADLDRAGELGVPAARVCLLRVPLKQAAGDADGAKRDLDEGLRTEPSDEHGWYARGLARMKSNPAGAAADFEKARAINPRSLNNLQNLSHCLGRLGKNEEAVKVLDQAVELYPDYVPSRAGRAVIHARLGHWAAAETDAVESLKRDISPSNQYQAAGTYALLSKHDPKHRAEALRLLTTALRTGFGFEHLETDKDLDPIRGDVEFKKVLDGARAIGTGRTG